MCAACCSTRQRWSRCGGAPDPCTLLPTSSLAVAYDGGQVTSLSVQGDSDHDPDTAWRAALPASFSSEVLFTTLTRLPALARLSLVSVGAWGMLSGAKLCRL